MKRVAADPVTWSQEDAISFECASEGITHAMAIISAEIDRIERDEQVDHLQLSRLTQLQAKMASERAGLYRLDPDAIKKIRKRYGAFVRAGRAGLAHLPA